MSSSVNFPAFCSGKKVEIQIVMKWYWPLLQPNPIPRGCLSMGVSLYPPPCLNSCSQLQFPMLVSQQISVGSSQLQQQVSKMSRERRKAQGDVPWWAHEAWWVLRAPLHMSLAPTRVLRAAGTYLSHRTRMDLGSSCHLEGNAIERSLERGFQGQGAFTMSLPITQHCCCSASGLGCGIPSPSVSCKLKQMWNTGTGLLHFQVSLSHVCRWYCPVSKVSSVSLVQMIFTLTRFTPTCLANVHWCVREENEAPCLSNQNHQRQNRRSLQDFYSQFSPTPWALTSPALPSCLCVKNILWKFEILWRCIVWNVIK